MNLFNAGSIIILKKYSFVFIEKNPKFRYEISIKLKHKTSRQLFCLVSEMTLFYIMTSWFVNLCKKALKTLQFLFTSLITYTCYVFPFFIFSMIDLYLQLYSTIIAMQISKVIYVNCLMKLLQKYVKNSRKKKPDFVVT